MSFGEVTVVLFRRAIHASARESDTMTLSSSRYSRCLTTGATANELHRQRDHDTYVHVSSIRIEGGVVSSVSSADLGVWRV